jgi:hypothetical protein
MRVLSPKEFQHLGSRVAVDQAFSRLSRAGKLLRVTRGTVVPVSSRFGSRAPAPEKVVKAMCRRGWLGPSARKPRVTEYFFSLGTDDRREALEYVRDQTAITASRLDGATVIKIRGKPILVPLIKVLKHFKIGFGIAHVSNPPSKPIEPIAINFSHHAPSPYI